MIFMILSNPSHSVFFTQIYLLPCDDRSTHVTLIWYKIVAELKINLIHFLQITAVWWD